MKLDRGQAVVFDLDGTLVDSRQDIVNAVLYTLDKLSYPPRSNEEIVSFIGSGVHNLISCCLPESLRGDESAIHAALDLFRQRYSANLTEETRPYPGCVDALEVLLRAGIRAWILTNKPGDMARSLVDDLGMKRLFEGVLGADDVDAYKPDPKGLLGICDKMGVPPSKVWYVGDMTIDVLTAKAAGCPSALVSWGYGGYSTLLKTTPDLLLRSPKDMMLFFAGLF